MDTAHTCTTSDGTPIEVGLIVINNDLKPVRVVKFAHRDWSADYPDADLEACGGLHGNQLDRYDHCWWKCERPDGTSAGSFDGTRMTRRYFFRNTNQHRTAEDLWVEAGGTL